MPEDFDIDVDTSGAEEGIDRATTFLSSLDEFSALCDSIVAEARSNLQNNLSVVTGELLGSIAVISIKNEDGDAHALIGTESEYAWYVEMGRGPVEPVTATVLHWIDKYTGEDVFATHAGPAEPRPFLWPAVIAETAKFSNVFSDAWDKEVAAF